jgi:membrane protein
VIAFVGLPITGWFWVDVLRSSIRTVWRLPEYPGNFFVRVFVDLLVLVGLGLLNPAAVTPASVPGSRCGYAQSQAAGRLTTLGRIEPGRYRY